MVISTREGCGKPASGTENLSESGTPGQFGVLVIVSSLGLLEVSPDQVPQAASQV